MLGMLLARAGVDVTLLEKHKDFRGDTIHPSTMQVLEGLGLLHTFLELPHQRKSSFSLGFGSTTIRLADFSCLAVRAPFIAMMPQWNFLNFLAKEAGDSECSGANTCAQEIPGHRSASCHLGPP